MEKEIIYPPLLQEGDLIAIISPATTVKAEYVAGGKAFLESRGFRVVIGPHALGPEHGSYAASDEERLADFLVALQDPDVKAIYCARGGYGCVHLLSHIPGEMVIRNPKWMIGFSDVSALHAFWHSCGVASLHAPMVKHITESGGDDACTKMLLDILTTEISPVYRQEYDSRSICGYAEGQLIGGNLAVLDGLAATPFDMLDVKKDEDVILFIEDIAEPIYKVERMLTRLYLAGTLNRLKGLVIGRFTEYRPDRNFNTVEEMITARLQQWGIRGIPVWFGFPVGHTDNNMPLIIGAKASLHINEKGMQLSLRR